MARFSPGWPAGFTRIRRLYINPSGFDFQLSIQIVIMVILGGMGSTAGVTLAAVLLTLLLEYLRFVAGYEWLPDLVRRIAANRMIIFSLVLIALMLSATAGTVRSVTAHGCPQNAEDRIWPGEQRLPELLEIKQCTVQFGGLTAVSKLDLHVGENDLVGLIGPNGAGKTTVFNIITGVYQPTSGSITFEGKTDRAPEAKRDRGPRRLRAPSKTSAFSPR